MKKMSANPSLESIASKPERRTDSEVDYKGFRVVDLGDDMFDDDSWQDFPAAQKAQASADSRVIEQLIEGELERLGVSPIYEAKTAYLQKPVVDTPGQFTIENKAPVDEIDAKVIGYARMRISGLVDINPVAADEQGGLSRSYIATWAKKDADDNIIEGKYFLKALLMANEDTKHEGQTQRAIALKVDEIRNRVLAISKRKKLTPKIQRESPVPHTYGTHIDKTSDGSYLPIIVMDFVQGTPLYKKLADPELSQLQKLVLFERFARAVGEIHNAGYVHLDVKGENALVTDDGQVVIIDYSLAAKKGYASKTEDVLGTIARMSPEHLTKTAREPRADVYSIGREMYVTLTGEEPFSDLDKYLGPGGSATAEYSTRLYEAMLNNEHFKNATPGVKNALFGLSDTLAGILYNATAGNPEDRYHDGIALANALMKAREEYTAELHNVFANALRQGRERQRSLRHKLNRGKAVIGKGLRSAYHGLVGREETPKQKAAMEWAQNAFPYETHADITNVVIPSLWPVKNE